MKRLIILLLVGLLMGCEAIFVDDISTKVINLTAPANNATVQETTVNFLWESVEGAERYQLQVARPGFANAQQVVLDTTITKNTFSTKLATGAYEWRVRGLNSEYATNYATRKFTLTSTDLSNAETTLISPLENAVVNTAAQKMQWTAVSGASEYRLQIGQPDMNGTIVFDKVLKVLNYTHSFNEGKFSWQVRPQSASQNGKYAQRKLEVDTKKPSNPQNTLPANNAVQTQTTIDFTWTRTDVPGTQELDSVFVYGDVNLTQLKFKDIGVNKSYKKENLTKGTYYWYVQAYDKAGNKSDKSSTFLVTLN